MFTTAITINYNEAYVPTVLRKRIILMQNGKVKKKEFWCYFVMQPRLAPVARPHDTDTSRLVIEARQSLNGNHSLEGLLKRIMLSVYSTHFRVQLQKWDLFAVAFFPSSSTFVEHLLQTEFSVNTHIQSRERYLCDSEYLTRFFESPNTGLYLNLIPVEESCSRIICRSLVCWVNTAISVWLQYLLWKVEDIRLTGWSWLRGHSRGRRFAPQK